MALRAVPTWVLAAILAAALLGNLAVVFQHGHLQAAIEEFHNMIPEVQIYRTSWTINGVTHEVVTPRREGWTEAQWAAAHQAAVAAHPFPPQTGG